MDLLRSSLTWLLIWLFAFAAPAQAMQAMSAHELAKKHCTARVYTASYPINSSDPSGLIENPSQVTWETAVQTAFSLQTLGRVAWSTFDAYVTLDGVKSAFGVGRGLAGVANLTQIFERNELMAATAAIDRGGLTVMGRALQKKAGRIGGVLYGKVSGNQAAINALGEQVVRETLESPWTRYQIRNTPRFGKVLEARNANGLGLRWDATTGKFIGILEP